MAHNSKEYIKVVMFGRNDVGKTTILYKLKLNRLVKTIPTVGFNVETVTLSDGTVMDIWDIGAGEDDFRWKSHHWYHNKASGFVFVVDSTSSDNHLELSRSELHHIVECKPMSKLPVLVLVNKQDQQGHMTPEDVFVKLDLANLKTTNKIHVQACSGLSGDGLSEGFLRMSYMIKDDKKMKAS